MSCSCFHVPDDWHASAIARAYRTGPDGAMGDVYPHRQLAAAPRIREARARAPVQPRLLQGLWRWRPRGRRATTVRSLTPRLTPDSAPLRMQLEANPPT